jgi:hypothetical protein
MRFGGLRLRGGAEDCGGGERQGEPANDSDRTQSMFHGLAFPVG